MPRTCATRLFLFLIALWRSMRHPEEPDAFPHPIRGIRAGSVACGRVGPAGFSCFATACVFRQNTCHRSVDADAGGLAFCCWGGLTVTLLLRQQHACAAQRTAPARRIAPRQLGERIERKAEVRTALGHIQNGGGPVKFFL